MSVSAQLTGPLKCQWVEGDEKNFYQTACRHIFMLTGSPKENHFKYCPFCGHQLKESDNAQK